MTRFIHVLGGMTAPFKGTLRLHFGSFSRGGTFPINELLIGTTYAAVIRSPTGPIARTESRVSVAAVLFSRGMEPL